MHHSACGVRGCFSPSTGHTVLSQSWREKDWSLILQLSIWWLYLHTRFICICKAGLSLSAVYFESSNQSGAAGSQCRSTGPIAVTSNDSIHLEWKSNEVDFSLGRIGAGSDASKGHRLKTAFLIKARLGKRCKGFVRRIFQQFIAALGCKVMTLSWPKSQISDEVSPLMDS